MFKVKLLVVPLTSGDLTRLKRCVYTVENQIPVREKDIQIDYDIKIVVNTKNQEYIQEVMDEFGDRYHVEVTESDGTPGTGKNSVFDFFRSQKKNYDYLFQIDGDDCIYPTAMHELSRYFKEAWDVVSFQSMDWISTNKSDNSMPFCDVIPGKLWVYSWLDNQINLRTIPAFKYVNDEGFGKEGGRIFTPGTSMVLSRKFLKNHPDTRHTNKIKLFEDYYFFLQLFNLHLKKKIRMCHVNNSFIYLYDRTNENSVSTHNCFYNNTEISLLLGYAKENDMMDSHPKDDLPFIQSERLDFSENKDKIHWIRHLVSKFPVPMKSLDLEKMKKEQMTRMNAIMMTQNPANRLAGMGIGLNNAHGQKM